MKIGIVSKSGTRKFFQVFRHLVRLKRLLEDLQHSLIIDQSVHQSWIMTDVPCASDCVRVVYCCSQRAFSSKRRKFSRDSRGSFKTLLNSLFFSRRNFQKFPLANNIRSASGPLSYIRDDFTRFGSVATSGILVKNDYAGDSSEARPPDTLSLSLFLFRCVLFNSSCCAAARSAVAVTVRRNITRTRCSKAITA